MVNIISSIETGSGYHLLIEKAGKDDQVKLWSDKIIKKFY